MEEKKFKKKKLTLSGSPKKSYNPSNYKQSGGKTSVVIEKKQSRGWPERKFHSRDSGAFKSKTKFPEKTNIKLSKDFGKKNTAADRNFEIRKMAEERATKRFKSLKNEDTQPKKGNLAKNT